MKKVLAQGFTLVELLIVIALLGVIATIVIAAINPIEQANKARDAGYKNDASELVSAVQRYYASQSAFPWQNVTGSALSSEDQFGWINVNDPTVGLCAAAGSGCQTSSSPAPLIQSYELENSFLNKSWIGTNVTGSDMLYIGKATGSSSGVYVCWVPKSNSNRQNLINSSTSTTQSNKMMDLSQGFSAAGTPVASTACTSTTGNGALGWTVAAPALPTCAECVPE